LATEVSSLRGELQQVRDERDRQLFQAQTLSSELEKIKESTKQSSTEVDSLTLKANDLEVGVCAIYFYQIESHSVIVEP